jgi:putative phosphonate metabolism protein
MAAYPRYAIYYAAALESDLHRFGSELLGYDAYTGEDLAFPGEITKRIPDWQSLTQDPRKYGFHATLKAPISLAPGKTEPELLAACEEFSGMQRPIPVIRPVVSLISGFIAIVPADSAPEVGKLATDCVRAFDKFRAPLTAEDRARRNPSKLTERQRDQLDRWGYPYVMEDFRFHMTLTGRLTEERRTPVLSHLQQYFSTLNMTTLQIDRIAVFRQDAADTRMRIISHHVLALVTATASQASI